MSLAIADFLVKSGILVERPATLTPDLIDPGVPPRTSNISLSFFDVIALTFVLGAILGMVILPFSLGVMPPMLRVNPLAVIWHYTGVYLVNLYRDASADGKLSVWIIPLWEIIRFVLPRIWSNLFVTSKKA
jgi:hypothetical protein